MAREWVVASSNEGKIRELDALLGPLRVRLRTQAELGIDGADEPFATFVENALAKARHASRGSGLPGLADDSGICVPEFGGAPGVRSARFGADWTSQPSTGGRSPANATGAALSAPSEAAAAGVGPPPGSSATREEIDSFNNRCLLAATRGIAQPVACFYYCAIVFVRHADDPCPLVADGVWHGTLAKAASGTSGFGYDPYFLPDGQGGSSAAAMAPAAKNRISHRAHAIASLVDALHRHRLA